MSTDRPAARPSSLADRARHAAWPLVSIAVVTVFAVLRIAHLTIPVGPDAVCATIYPPTPGCAGDARWAPAALWLGLTLAAATTTVTATLGGKLSKQLSWLGVAITGAIALYGIREVEYV